MPPIRTSSLYPHFAELFGGLPLPEDIIECASPLVLRAFLQDGLRLALLGASVLSQPMTSDLIRLPVALRSSPGPLGLYQVAGRFIPVEAALFRDILLEDAMKVEAQGSSRHARRS